MARELFVRSLGGKRSINSNGGRTVYPPRRELTGRKNGGSKLRLSLVRIFALVVAAREKNAGIQWQDENLAEEELLCAGICFSPPFLATKVPFLLAFLLAMVTEFIGNLQAQPKTSAPRPSVIRAFLVSDDRARSKSSPAPSSGKSNAGGVDYRDCLERKELVERLEKTKNFIPPAAKRLLQQYLEGAEPPPHLSYELLHGSSPPVEDWWLDAEKNSIKLFQDCSPSVAHITTLRLGKDMSMNPVEIPRGTGSGFVWDKDGHIVTNYHVTMNGERARVTLSDASTWDGTLVGYAKNKDLAVLKISAPPSKLKPISVGTSQGLQVGQHVLAIGNPFGLDRTLTSGIISGVGRDIRSIGGRIIRGVIQTDASINPGNSGGPLLDSQGRLIGVNTAIYSPTGASAGVGFAIPVDTVRRVINQIIRDGKVVRPGLGIVCASESQTRQLGVTGVLVLGLSSNGAAAQAGLKATSRDENGRLVLGDVIVAINGEAVKTVEDLLALIDERCIEEVVRVSVKRGSSIQDYYITLEELEE
ncbi:protease Do-like 1, chloroplastic isoform X2 [Selaginella moellendorffii]|uniref:protease Do-like 1, chloroplastic isoform X2 n=1 Tax=Selaginella moellendorffii TaxID=88036 RepID=UPI000D1C4267|nr:protease Do-like 1, chloroplastic isoform X2 [Selaginella moellendorffii]|eukprot:XP_024520008.1 protease Do-like 1, chloroplastic isoform X2 [Selaginella moellendorffii]